MDIRYEKLANTLVHHSTKLKPQEKVLIHAIDIPRDMVLCLIRAVRDCNAIPFVQVQDGRIDRECILGAEEIQFETSLEWEMQRMKIWMHILRFEDRLMYLRILTFHKMI